MSNKMKLLCFMLLSAACLHGNVETRHLNSKRSNQQLKSQDAFNESPVDRQGLLPVIAQIATAQGDSNGEPAEVRGPFDDFVPYVSSFVYRDSVKKWLISPMIKGSKYIMPSRAVTYYRTRLANRRFFRIISPLYPALSSYTNKKFEQGIFWTLNRGYTFVRDKFFEFDDDE